MPCIPQLNPPPQCVALNNQSTPQQQSHLLSLNPHLRPLHPHRSPLPHSPRPLQPLVLQPLHLLLHLRTPRHHPLPLPRNPPPLQPLPPQRPQRLPLHNTIRPILPIKIKRLLHAHRRIRNNPYPPQRIMTRTMQHQRMQQIHIAHLPRHLHKRLIRHPPRDVTIKTQIRALGRERRVLRPRRHAAGYALGVSEEVLCD